jgi:competence protein ComEA
MKKIFEWLRNERVKKSLLMASVMLLGVGIICLMTFYFSLPVLELESVACEPLNSSFVEEVVVDIGGAVQTPGIYRLADNQRLADLITLAGGFLTDQVDRYYLQKSLNLAEVLVNEKKYYIPYEGEMMTGTSEVEVMTGMSEEEDNLISINQANLKTLMTLSGIGEVRGQAIIDNRPYSALEDLLLKAVITEKVFDSIKGELKL